MAQIIAAWAMESGAVKSKARLSMGAFGAYMRDYIIGAFKQQGPQINFFLYLALKKCHLLIKAAKEMIQDHMECVEARKAAIRCVGELPPPASALHRAPDATHAHPSNLTLHSLLLLVRNRTTTTKKRRRPLGGS